MAPLPAVPDVCKVRLIWTDYTDDNANCNLHFQYLDEDTPMSADLAGVIGESIATAYGTYLKPFASANVTLTGVDVLDINTLEGVGVLTPTSQVGTLAVQPCVQSTAVVISHTIRRRYRGGKPRNYFPFGAPVEQGDGAHWNSGWIDSLQEGWDAFISAIVDPDSGPINAFVNVGYFSGFENVPYGDPVKYRKTPKLRDGGPVVDPITSSIVKTRIGTQRRRIGKR